MGETEVPNTSEPLALPALKRFVVEDGGKRRFRVLGEAFGPKNEPLAFAFAWAELATTDGSALSSVTSVPLPAWSKAYRPFTMVLANPPVGAATAVAQLGVVVGEGTRFERGTTQARVDRETTLGFLVPEPLGLDLSSRLEIGWDGTADKAVLARRGTQTSVRIDLATDLLPRVSSALVEPTADRARPLVRWSVAGDASHSDVVVARITWPETRDHVWTILAPPTTPPRLRVPALPSVLADWRPDERAIAAAVAVLESSEYATYDEVRRKGIDVAGDGVEDDADGRLRWSATGDLAF